jgi:hypothetical protein
VRWLASARACRRAPCHGNPRLYQLNILLALTLLYLPNFPSEDACREENQNGKDREEPHFLHPEKERKRAVGRGSVSHFLHPVESTRTHDRESVRVSVRETGVTMHGTDELRVVRTHLPRQLGFEFEFGVVRGRGRVGGRVGVSDSVTYQRVPYHLWISHQFSDRKPAALRQNPW